MRTQILVTLLYLTLIQNLLHGYQLTLKVVSREQLHFFYAPSSRRERSRVASVKSRRI